jgi:hypothetical protein
MDECRGTWGSYVYYGSICVFKWGTTACQVIIYTIEQYVCLYMGKGGGGHINRNRVLEKKTTQQAMVVRVKACFIL